MILYSVHEATPALPQTSVPVRYCTNPTTGIVEEDEEFTPDPRSNTGLLQDPSRNPRNEFLQQVAAGTMSLATLVQQPRIVIRNA